MACLGRSGDGVLGAFGAVFAEYRRRLGGSLGRLGAVPGTLEARLEQFGELPRPFRTHLDGSGYLFADLLTLMVLSRCIFLVLLRLRLA